MKKIKVMVELRSGYGDGYGVVVVDEDGRFQTRPRPSSKVTYSTRMDAGEDAILSAPLVHLLDGGVMVPLGTIQRIIGPLDCDEAVVIRARRYTKNWSDNTFVGRARAEELRAALSHEAEPDNHSAFCALRIKYATA